MISATDSTGRASTLKVTITILGVMRPLVLSSDEYEATVSGDGPIGTKILSCPYKSADLSRPSNSPVSYTLINLDSASTRYFSVDMKGVITLTTIPPFSRSNQIFVMNLTVHDLYNPALADWAVVTITVTPATYIEHIGNLTFSKEFYNFEIRDDAKVGDYVGEVMANRTGGK